MSKNKWMFKKKEDNIKMFRDTIKQVSHNSFLLDALSYSIENQKVYLEPKKFDIKNKKVISYLPVKVTPNRVIKECINIHKENPLDKIIILNFASAKHPGGMVTNGSNAQEESICRVSFLWQCLSSSSYADRSYYKYHKELKGEYSNLYSSRCIYTPKVYIFKDDTIIRKRTDSDDYNILKDMFCVDVISAPAPNLRSYSQQERTSSKLKNKSSSIFKERIESIIRISQLESEDEEENTHLLLGAWGCGVFKNDPFLVANSFKEVLENYGNNIKFKEIIFPIPLSEKDHNYEIFKNVLS